MPVARLHGPDIYYERSGSGPPLVLCNGSGATVAETGPLVQQFAGSFHVAVLDGRGLGCSGRATAPYEMADLAADTLAVADDLGWRTFRLAGMSFGGMVAQELAVTVPGRVERLALLCTSPGGAGGSSYPLDELAALDPSQRASLYPRLLDTRFTPEWLADHDGDRALAAMLVERQERERPPSVREGEALQLQARKGHDVFDRLPCITCPTLVASGRFDGIAPAANGAAIAREVPGAELRIFEGGHLFVLQDPGALPSVLGFLGDG